MIFLRLAIIPLGLAFMAVLFVALAFLRLDGGLLNPDYYPSLLKKTDVYRFVTVDVLSSALDETRRLGLRNSAAISTRTRWSPLDSPRHRSPTPWAGPSPPRTSNTWLPPPSWR